MRSQWSRWKAHEASLKRERKFQEPPELDIHLAGPNNNTENGNIKSFLPRKKQSGTLREVDDFRVKILNLRIVTSPATRSLFFDKIVISASRGWSEIMKTIMLCFTRPRTKGETRKNWFGGGMKEKQRRRVLDAVQNIMQLCEVKPLRILQLVAHESTEFQFREWLLIYYSCKSRARAFENRGMKERRRI